jgi:hypothetical protein
MFHSLSAVRPRRYPLLLPLRVWIRSWSKKRSAAPAPEPVEEETITTNISSAGCYFLLSEEPPVGSAVEMEIAMQPEPGKKPHSKMVASGKVVRVEKEPVTGKTGVGCEFERYRLVPNTRKHVGSSTSSR